MEIRFDHVSFVIDAYTPLEKTIISDVTFEIKNPGIYSFIGKSNSGKTAIGDLINALIMPTRGRVKIGRFINDGRMIKNINKLRFQTGYVFKNPYDMFFNKTVKSEIEFGMKYFKYKLEKIDLRASDALKLVGLDDSYLNMNPHELTLVDAKKVALACALVYNPNILILDEYTAGLNSNDKKELIRLLRLLKNKYKKTIILLSKDTNFCYQITDYVYLMHMTKLVAFGGKELLRDIDALNQIGVEVPKIVTFIDECKKKGRYIHDYDNILDLIKGVYRDVF